VVIEEAGSAESALHILSRYSFDLVLTDIRMGEISGLDLLAEIRKHWPDVVVILLTGYASLESAIQALRRGAHDYLLKPASIHEVRSSVREGLAKRHEALRRQELMANLREGILELSQGQGEGTSQRPSPEAPGTQQNEGRSPPRRLQVGDLTVDRAEYLVAVAGIGIDLTPTEFRLLVYLLENRGRVVPYEELVQKVHGYECDPFEARQLIIPHVSNLRRKLRTTADSPDPIKNVRGVGYTLP
jgi:DNA-binding response OmpR family regulator